MLYFTSLSSPLYPFNTWVDANAFFTVGKSMFNGIVPYRDIFEQKGIILYLVYGIGYLISNRDFLGVFILEVISWTVTLYYLSKITNLFMDNKYNYVLLPIFTALATTCESFVQGGSAEEFCFPYMVISLFYMIKYFKDGKIKRKEFMIIGVMAGIVLLIKYTILGLWIGFIMAIVIMSIRKKQILKMIREVSYFLLGMLTPVLITLIYFLLVGGLKEFIDVYFVVNMTMYGNTSANIVMRLFYMLNILFSSAAYNNFIVIFLLLVYPLMVRHLNLRNGKWGMVMLLVGQLIGIYWGMMPMGYYFLPILVLEYLSLVGLMLVFERYVPKLALAFKRGIVILIVILCIIGGICGANYKNLRGTKKEDLFQYKFAEVINKEAHPTLINIGFLDGGIYTVTWIIPNTYFFEQQNLNYERFPYNRDAFGEYIRNKKTMFVVYCFVNEGRRKNDWAGVEEDLFVNYDLIDTERYLDEGHYSIAYLFKVKE